MEIKLDSLVVTNYDSKDLDKVKFVREIGEDKNIRRYVSPNIEEVLMRPNYTGDIENAVAYIVKDQDKCVGFVKPSIFFDTEVGLDYGVHPEYRKKGYGTKILLEVSDYFFKKNFQSVVLCIDNSNKASINAALKAGFVKNDVGFDLVSEYIKERK